MSTFTHEQMEQINAGADARVARLEQHEFDSWAEHAVASLRTFGYAFCRLCPGDMTMYQISIVHPITPAQWLLWEHSARKEGDPPPHPSTGSYYVATGFGPMYPWDGQFIEEWGYVYQNWTSRRPLPSPDGWTARILLRFLNTVHAKLNEPTP